MLHIGFKNEKPLLKNSEAQTSHPVPKRIASRHAYSTPFKNRPINVFLLLKRLEHNFETIALRQGLTIIPRELSQSGIMKRQDPYTFLIKKWGMI